MTLMTARDLMDRLHEWAKRREQPSPQAAAMYYLGGPSANQQNAAAWVNYGRGGQQ